MISKSLIELIFEAASIERWNDHIRPSRGFTELDKQSHKMLYAYVLGKLTPGADWNKLIEGGIFEFLHRIMLTDIKPPIFHSLMNKKGGQINRWVLDNLKEQTAQLAGGFSGRFEEYLMNPAYGENEKQILKAAHYLATKWEFDIIFDMCRNYYGIEQTREEIDSQLRQFSELQSLSGLYLDANLMNFTNLVGELRFQQRWSRSPRIPPTSVMGHMLVVAILSYFCSLEIGAGKKRTENNFLGGLFHDLPEVLTRDIVSPVKNSVEGLDEIIKEIEESRMQSAVYSLIPAEWQEQIEYYTQNEFNSKIIIDGKMKKVSSGKITRQYNADCFCPIDGEIIRGCDHLAAHIETYLSITFGVKSDVLQDANRALYAQYRDVMIGGIDFGKLFGLFRVDAK